LEGTPRAWDDFVDRFLGLILHVINHTSKARGVSITPSDQEDISADVMLELLRNDFAALRRFRRTSSLATYLTVIVRRMVVRRLLSESLHAKAGSPGNIVGATPSHEQHVINRDEVEQLIHRLDAREANAVRLYHLEGKSYGQISQAIGVPENSVGPMLSRARAKMRGNDSIS
jgi:RNA polymerase sigma-70 factor (ECF subfamily)